ncbi:hypothetical protein V7266_19460, partial [Neobacillus drentensis]|uniref:hypothetical protein n=1 Tax=Neobacillus drentensis TaxID=220684 RepID=UPI0030000639
FYEKLPNDVLIDFYNEINNNIIHGGSTQKLYFELGLIYSIMCRRGIISNRSFNKEDVVATQTLKNYSA